MNSFDFNNIESYIKESKEVIEENMKIYGFALDDIREIRNYYDMASLLSVDSRQLSDCDLVELSEIVAGCIETYIC